MIKHKKTKIIATLGPACHDVEILKKMLLAGMNCARFNFSHGDHQEHLERLQLLRKAEAKTGIPCAHLLDTKGPEIRTGNLIHGLKELILKDGNQIRLSGSIQETTKDIIAISHSKIHKEINIGSNFKIADGSIIIETVDIQNDIIIGKIIKGGALESKKNINVSDATINLPNLMQKDIEDIHFAIEHDYDFIAASFIRTAEDILKIQDILKEKNSNIQIIAKIENQEGLDNLDNIIQITDGIMIARGDLAEQIPAEQVPLRQKSIIDICNYYHKISITATQMLQSMETSMTPTRAELTDIANAIFDGTDALMLSGESAKGKFPVESIETMTRVSIAVEESEQFQEHARTRFFSNRKGLFGESSSSESIIAAAQIAAEKSNASAFICPSLSGHSPKYISVLKPNQHIVVTTHFPHIVRRLLLLWGVAPVLTKECTSDAELIETGINAARKLGFLKKNGKVVIIGGFPINKPLMLNTVQVYFDGKVIMRGRQGCGPAIKGEIFHVSSPSQILKHAQKNMNKSIIYVSQQLTYDMLPILSEIKALIVKQKTSIPMLTLQKQFSHLTCIAGVEALTFGDIKDGKEIVLSGNEQLIYEP